MSVSTYMSAITSNQCCDAESLSVMAITHEAAVLLTAVVTLAQCRKILLQVPAAGYELAPCGSRVN